jgi:hypothetical protein
MADVEIKQRAGGWLGPGVFCCAPHPEDPDVWCRRLPHLDDEHSAFQFSIKTPVTWQGGDR